MNMQDSMGKSITKLADASNLCGAFEAFWNANGGLLLQISDNRYAVI